MCEKIKTASANGLDIAALQKEKEDTAKIAKSENRFNETPPDFARHLHNELRKSNMCGDAGILGSIKCVLEGEYQADLPIARRHKSTNNQSDVIIANDADFAMCIGRELIQLRDFKFDAKNKKINSLALGFACNKLAGLAQEVLEAANKSIRIKHAESVVKKKTALESPNNETIPLDLFAQCNDLEMRALIGFACGCNVYKGGVPGFGPATTERHTSHVSETQQSSMKNLLKSMFAEKLKTDVLTIDAHLQVTMHEPANAKNLDAEEESGLKEYQHVWEAPTSLTKCYKDFCSSGLSCAITDNGPEVLLCKGHACMRDHFYLAIERKTCATCGEYKCRQYKCRHCACKEISGEERELCMKCFKFIALEGTCDADTEGREKMIEEIQKISHGGGHSFINDCTVDEVQAMCQTNVVEGKMNIDVSSVQHPLATPEHFQNDKAMEDVREFNVYRDGGSFINKQELLPHLPSILSHLATSVTFDSTVWYTPFDSPVHKSIPSFLTTMASKCRRDSGHRLCTQCLRHGTDPKYLPTEMSKIRVVKVLLDNTTKIAFDWSTKVPASMLSLKCDTRSCVTSDGELHAHDCSCKADGDNAAEINSEQHAACMHILPNAMKLSVIVTDYVADDLCRELDNVFCTNIAASTFSETEIKSIEQSTRAIALAIVALLENNICVSDLMEIDLCGMLAKCFGVGTNKAKRSQVGAAHELEHVPISNLKKKSVASVACTLFKREVKDGANSVENNNSFERCQPECKRVAQMVGSFHKHADAAHHSFIGFLLLFRRANVEDIDSSVTSVRAFKEEWKKIVEAASLRSRKPNKCSRSESLPAQQSAMKRQTVKNKEETKAKHIRKHRSRHNEQTAGGEIGGKPTSSWSCQFPGCKNNNLSKDVRWHKAPTLKKFPETKRCRCIRNFFIQKKCRFVVLDRLSSRAKMMLTPPWCSAHEAPAPHIDSVVITFKGKQTTERAPFTPIPVNKGPRQEVASTSRGVAVDRHNAAFINSLDDCQQLLMSLAQKAHSPDRQNSKSAEKMLPTLESAGTTPRKMHFSDANVVTPPSDNNVDCCCGMPAVMPGMKDSKVQRRTGFVSEQAMLMHVVIMCNGDLNKLKTTTTTMTWYEEKFAHFERTWGHTVRREIDLEKACRMDRCDLRDVIHNMLEAELTCRRSWPTHSSFDEDMDACSES